MSQASPTPVTVAIQHPYLHPDLVVYLDEHAVFQPGTVSVGRAQDLRPGAGAYSGAMLHRFGHPVRYFDRVGNDLFGSYTLQRLRDWGHDVSGVVRYEGPSQVCTSIADAGTLGGTMVITYPSEWQQTFEQARDLVQAARGSPHATYLWSWFWSYAHLPLAGTPTSELVELAARDSSLLLLDPNWKPAGAPPTHELDQLRRGLQYVDILKPNIRDARLIGGDLPLPALVRSLLDLGAPLVVITDGERGCVAASRHEDGIVRIPTPALAVRDTTGAGDYFGGALMHAVSSGRGLVEAAAVATAASALAISRPQGSDLPAPEVVDDLSHTLLARTENLA